MGHFCQAADKIFTEHNTKYKLKGRCNFGSIYNVPVGFLLIRSWLKFARLQKRFDKGS